MKKNHKMAETKVRQKTKIPPNPSLEDFERVVQELEVHQVELETQNEELRTAQVKLEESRQQYSDLYDFSPIGYFSFDPAGLILSVNLTGAGQLGVDRRLLIKKPFHFFVDPRDQDRFRDHLQSVFRTQDRYECEIRIQKRRQVKSKMEKDAQPFYAQMDSIFVKNAAGQSSCRTAISDITLRKRAEEELFQATRLESVGLLAGGIAHDFNNILTVIIGNLSLARIYLGPEHKAFQKLGESEKAALRGQMVTRQLLTFSKGGRPIRKNILMTPLLKESAHFVLQGSNVKCEFLLPETLWPVEVDEGQISQVIHNLMINAQKAMPAGGMIQINGENVVLDKEAGQPLPPGKYIRITIRDEGEGIPPENLARVFEPFFTTRPDGHGLGLATAYWIIKRHDGRLTVESAPGEGATFFIYLPASGRMLLDTDKDADTDTDILTGGGRVLFMDDEAAIREIANEILTRLGYEVMCCEEGRGAVERYREARESGRPFDVVILDLTVAGGMGGRETVEKLRKIDPKVRAIVSSGYSDHPVLAEFKEYGFSERIAKPYTLESLSKIVKKCLKEKG
ncbi:MAG: hybrid sensor histidine kinase/response regulator [Nitrospiria bacterium]